MGVKVIFSHPNQVKQQATMFHYNNIRIAMFGLRQFADSSCLLTLTEHGGHVLVPMWEAEEFRAIIGQNKKTQNAYHSFVSMFMHQWEV